MYCTLRYDTFHNPFSKWSFYLLCIKERVLSSWMYVHAHLLCCFMYACKKNPLVAAYEKDQYVRVTSSQCTSSLLNVRLLQGRSYSLQGVTRKVPRDA